LVNQQFFYTYENVALFPCICESYDSGTGETTIDVSLVITGFPAVFTVRPSGPARIIRHLRVHASGPANSYLSVLVQNPDLDDRVRTISRVYEISPVTGSKPLSVGCTDVGQLGAPDDPALIFGSQIGVIRTIADAGLPGHTGNAYATIIALAGAPLTGSAADLIRIGGNFLGSIVASDHIDRIDATGTLGSSSSLASIASKTIFSIAASSIHADISTSSSNDSDFIQRIEARTGPIVGSVSTFRLVPSSTMGQLVCFLKAAGDLDANVTIEQDVDSRNGSDPVIDIGGEFKAGRKISIGTWLLGQYLGSGVGGLRVRTPGGLKGQVIINERNIGGGWASVATIGTGAGAILLGPGQPGGSAYQPTAASLGGGSIGLVPFRLHATDCTPISGGNPTFANSPSASNPIKVRHYGPVTFSGTPMLVTRRPLGSSGSFITFYSGCFSFVRDANTNVVLVTPSNAPSGITPVFPNGWEYKITPVPAVLKCETTNTPDVSSYEHTRLRRGRRRLRGSG
jgi:hypothetical protein